MASYSKYLLIGLPALALAGLAALVWWQKKEKKRTYKEVGRVSELFIYPVKSCKGISLTEVKCFKEGMEFDRHWMLLDKNDVFVTQRADPKLALVTPHFEGDRYLCLDAPGMATLKVDMQAGGGEPKRIKVWGTYGEGLYVGDEASEWFSNYLNRTGYKMYKLSKPRLIKDDKTWSSVALPDDKVSFGDFAPYMILTDASLAALNRELQTPVPMKRFRPNVVVSGLGAFEEMDEWTDRRIKVGDLEFRYLNCCSRCSLTTVNPDTGEKKGDEPLATLRRIRPADRDPRYGSSPLFGVYVAPVGNGVGVMRQGDSVMIST